MATETETATAVPVVCGRADAAQPVALLARALTFPTPELDALADETMLYMAHTASLSVTIDASVEGGERAAGQCDSDWSVGHSTTGFFLMLAGAPLVYSSKRQPCIAMSSTEAEIIAASSCACEIVYIRTLLEEMGLPQEDPTPLPAGHRQQGRDRARARPQVVSPLAPRRPPLLQGARARSVRVLKVHFVPTDANHADILTKGLPLPAFRRHRAALLDAATIAAVLLQQLLAMCV